MIVVLVLVATQPALAAPSQGDAQPLTQSLSLDSLPDVVYSGIAGLFCEGTPNNPDKGFVPTDLGNAVQGFFKITTALGLVGVGIIWQFDALAGLLSLSPQRKKELKEHRREALGSGATLLLIGPLFTFANNAMSLGLRTNCLDLIPI
jgi:hypothetical protein